MAKSGRMPVFKSAKGPTALICIVYDVCRGGLCLCTHLSISFDGVRRFVKGVSMSWTL